LVADFAAGATAFYRICDGVGHCHVKGVEK
jgi:hypothetical protein